jgi:hypothetical protein
MAILYSKVTNKNPNVILGSKVLISKRLLMLQPFLQATEHICRRDLIEN